MQQLNNALRPILQLEDEVLFATACYVVISVDRVQQRTLLGGHDVPEDRIRKRYARTLNNLLEAMRLSYRAYLFDNSQTMKLVAETSDKKQLIFKTEHIPVWVEEHVLEKLI